MPTTSKTPTSPNNKPDWEDFYEERRHLPPGYWENVPRIRPSMPTPEPEKFIDMDFIKGSVKAIPQKATQPKVSDKRMEDDFICVFRERDLLRNQIHNHVVKNTPGVFNRFKRKIGNLFNHN